MAISYNKPFATGKELAYINEAVANMQLSGDGPFGRRCEAWLEKQIGSARVLLTNSATAALEMIALLLRIEPGDEVIMPSFTFVSTANAFVLRGGIPVFVDIRPDTLNIDQSKIEAAITEKTRAIVIVHYAGVACDMDAIMGIGKRRGIPVIEDAAHAITATYRGEPLGSFGDLSALSFHETKNLICGEGGALVINNPDFVSRAEIIRDKGTNRKQFFRGQVDKYTWVDVGSSYVPSELQAAFLWAQIEEADSINKGRLSLWNNYYHSLKELEKHGHIQRPVITEECGHNAHLFYVLLERRLDRDNILKHLKDAGVDAIFHYVPLHNSPAGLALSRVAGSMAITEDVSSRLIRLPLWLGMTDDDVSTVVNALQESILATVKATALSQKS